MARLTGALFSLAASGTIADTLTFAKWKGIQYVRTRVIPANPKTAPQIEVRAVFKFLSDLWKRMPALAREPWEFAVRGRPLTARNQHVKSSLKLIQSEVDLDLLVMGLQTGSAIPLDTAPGVDGADGTITCTATEGVAPVGMTIASVTGVACLDGIPDAGLDLPTYVNEDVTTPFAIVVDVPTDDDYQFAAWPIYTRDSDGLEFAGTPIRSQVAVTGN